MEETKEPKRKRVITVGTPPRQRIIYEDDEGREYYVKSVRGQPKGFYLDEEFISDKAELDPERLVSELSNINAELTTINEEAKRLTKGYPGTRLETTKIRILTLRHRSDLLVKLLNKSLTDKNLTEHRGSVGISSSTDSIPDEILVAAVAGKLSEKQLEQMELLMVEGIGGEH